MYILISNVNSTLKVLVMYSLTETVWLWVPGAGMNVNMKLSIGGAIKSRQTSHSNQPWNENTNRKDKRLERNKLCMATIANSHLTGLDCWQVRDCDRMLQKYNACPVTATSKHMHALPWRNLNLLSSGYARTKSQSMNKLILGLARPVSATWKITVN